MKPLCFVLLPIEREFLFEQVIAPAIEAAGLEPVCADASALCAGEPVFERLILCDFAVADLTGALTSAPAVYGLGLRHGVQPGTTVLLAEASSAAPLGDDPLLQPLSYTLDAQGQPQDSAGLRDALTGRLHEARRQRGGPVQDSPVFQLAERLPGADLARLKTDVFRERARYAETTRRQLEAARCGGQAAVRQVAAGLGDLDRLEAGVLVDLLLSHRAVSDWPAMIELVERLPAPVARSKLVQEQYAFALNRHGRRDEAEAVLRRLIQAHGPNSETNPLLGRLYKDRWDDAVKAGDTLGAPGLLHQAIETYLQGFEADWRDAFPGINAVTLMELAEPPDPRRTELLPVVTYAVRRRIAQGQPDYWDHATLLELAVLREDANAAGRHASDAIAAIRERWEPETTARNLRLIREARAARGVVHAWADRIEDGLRTRAA